MSHEKRWFFSQRAYRLAVERSSALVGVAPFTAHQLLAQLAVYYYGFVCLEVGKQLDYLLLSLLQDREGGKEIQNNIILRLRKLSL